MKKLFIKLIILVAMLLLLAASLLIPEPYAHYAAYAELPLFLTVLLSLMMGSVYGSVFAVTAPFVEYILLTTKGSFLPDVPMWCGILILTAIFTDLMFRMFKTSVGAAVMGVIFSRIMLSIGRLITCFIETKSYTISSYVEEAYVKVWPGLILTIVLVPIIFRILVKTKATHFLRNYLEER